MSVSTKESVALGSAVATDYINLKVGISECSGQVAEQVEYPGIVLMNFAGPVVAQITVEANQSFLLVTFAVAVDDVQPFASMGVKKMQLVGPPRNGRQFWLSFGTGDRLAG